MHPILRPPRTWLGQAVGVAGGRGGGGDAIHPISHNFRSCRKELCPIIMNVLRTPCYVHVCTFILVGSRLRTTTYIAQHKLHARARAMEGTGGHKSPPPPATQARSKILQQQQRLLSDVILPSTPPCSITLVLLVFFSGRRRGGKATRTSEVHGGWRRSEYTSAVCMPRWAN